MGGNNLREIRMIKMISSMKMVSLFATFNASRHFCFRLAALP